MIDAKKNWARILQAAGAFGLGTLLLVTLGSRANAARSMSFGSSPADATITHDAHGLEKEFEPFLHAYAKGDAAAEQTALEIFAMPDTKDWFAAHFAAGDQERLQEEYARKLGSFQKSYGNIMPKFFPGLKKFHLECAPHDSNGTPSKIPPRSDAMMPTDPVVVENFEMRFVAENGRAFSQRTNFVYEHGAFRFVGGGAYPFWSMPEVLHHKPANEEQN